MKDFDKWNEIIKIVENRENKNFHEREIWWCRLGNNVGHEQDGKGSEYSRPVLVVKKFNNTSCLIAPLTTQEKKNKYHVEAVSEDGVARFVIVSQIKFADSKRFDNKIGYINEESFTKIKKAIKNII